MSYYELWIADKRSMLQTMQRNMSSDLECGYSPNGNCIIRQKVEIERYAQQFDDEQKALRTMSPNQAEHWCKVDLIRRGAIEVF